MRFKSSDSVNQLVPRLRVESIMWIVWRLIALVFSLNLVAVSTSTSADGLQLSDTTVIGIDLGTTYSCVAIYHEGRVDIIPNEQGNRITPSWVGFSDNERLIGDAAKQAFHKMPSQTIFDAKRLIGRRYDDVSLQEDIRHWPFKVVNNNGLPGVEIAFHGLPKIFTPQEISAMILEKMKKIAEGYLGHAVTRAVITIPAYFNDEQRQATKHAGEIAGLNVLRMISEPTAAAIAYGLMQKKWDRKSKIIVFMAAFLKSWRLQVTCVWAERISNNRVMDYFVALYHRQTGTNVSKNGRAMSKLKREVEKAKRTLSSQPTARLEIESFEGGHDFSATLTRATFEELNLDLFRRTLKPVSKVIRDAQLSPEDIDDVVLIGGSTRIPVIRQMLKDFFGGLEPRIGVNADEAVSYGAAIQGSILAGAATFDDIISTETSAHTLGVQTDGGVSTPLIPRNTRFPVQKSETFSTSTNNQRVVLIKVLQGESTIASENTLLGTFKLGGIPPLARGVPQIKVTFDIDADGILNVTAFNRDSGNMKSITIVEEKPQLSKKDISRMINEARMLDRNDREARERSTALNLLHEMVSRYVYSLDGRMMILWKLAAKRAELHAADKQAENLDAHSALEEHRRWAESLGGSADLAELNRRVKEVDLLRLDHKAFVEHKALVEHKASDKQKPEEISVAALCGTSSTPSALNSDAMTCVQIPSVLRDKL
ncbi:ATPase with role in protein import into the ER [Ceratobasidium sp. 395]|nr:ATPase with role in protein import into the ER [Ceratobasidium sp. 395]